MKLYENKQMSDEKIKEYLGQKALFFSVLAGYSRTPDTNLISFNDRQLAAIEQARKVFDIHLTILNTPLDDYSANPEQRDIDSEHQSGIDADKVDFYTNSMGTVSTALRKDDEDEGLGLDEETTFTDAEEGLTVNEIYSYSNAASKFRRDMIAASGLLADAARNKALTVSEMNRLYSLLSSIKSNSFVERDLVGYDPFNDYAIQGKNGPVPVKDDMTNESFTELMNMVGHVLEPTEGVNLLAQQGLSITLGNNFYNDLMSADILDKGRYNKFKNGLDSNLISRTDKNAVNDGDLFADLMIKNSKKLETAAWDQYLAVKDLFGEKECMTMLANIQIIYQKTLAKINRNIPLLQSDIASRQAVLKKMAQTIGMEENVDYSLDPEINLSGEDIDAFIARNDVLENLDLSVESEPEFMASVKEYNAAYLSFAEKKKRLYDTLTFLSDPVNANQAASLQNLITSSKNRQDFVKTLNANPHLAKPSLYNATEIAVLRSKFISDVNSTVRIHRSEKELNIKPRSREELKILNALRAIEDRIGEEDNMTKLLDTVSAIDRETVKREMDEFVSQSEIAPFFKDVSVDEMTDYYMRSAELVERFSQEFMESGTELAKAGCDLNEKIRENLARTQVTYLSQAVPLSEEEKAALMTKFETDAVFTTFEKNIHKDLVFTSTDEELSVVNDLKAEYGNTTSLVYGSACPVSPRENCRIAEKNNPFTASQRLQDLATSLKDYVIDVNGEKSLSEEERVTVKENLLSGMKNVYDAMHKDARLALEDASIRIARYSEEQERMIAFNPDAQINYGYEAKKIFDSFVEGSNREADFIRLQTLLSGIVGNNPGEADNAKKINAYLLSEVLKDGSAPAFASEFVKKGIIDVDTHYNLDDVRSVVDTLMVAGEANKIILAEFRKTGDHTKLKRISQPEVKDKNHYENMIVTSYNDFYKEDRLEDLRKQLSRARTDQYISRNSLEEIEKYTPEVFACATVGEAAVAKGLADSQDVAFFKEKTKEFENTLLKEKGYNILKNVSSLTYGKEDQYLKNAQEFYTSVVDLLSEEEKNPSADRDEKLQKAIFRRNEDYAHPLQEMYRKEKTSDGAWKMSAATVAAISPEASTQRYSLSVLPSENFNMAAFKTTVDSKDRAMLDFVNVKNLYATVKGQSMYTYPVNKGIDTLYRLGLDNLNVRRSVADEGKQMTAFGQTVSDAKKADKTFNTELTTFAIKNLPATKEYVDGFKKVLISRGVRKDLVESMQFVPSKRTNNTVVNISSEVLKSCSQKDQMKLKSTITDIYIREKGHSKAPHVTITGNEGATRRIINAISRDYSEMSKSGVKKPSQEKGTPSRSRADAF